MFTNTYSAIAVAGATLYIFGGYDGTQWYNGESHESSLNNGIEPALTSSRLVSPHIRSLEPRSDGASRPWL